MAPPAAARVQFRSATSREVTLTLSRRPAELRGNHQQQLPSTSCSRPAQRPRADYVPAGDHVVVVALEQSCEASSSSNSRVGQVRDQRKKAYQTINFPVAGHGNAIAPEQDRAASTGSSIGLVRGQRKEVAMTLIAQTAGYGGALATEQDCVAPTSSNCAWVRSPPSARRSY